MTSRMPIARMENEAQLAMVLAHEIARVTERHVTKGIERVFGMQAGRGGRFYRLGGDGQQVGCRSLVDALERSLQAS